MKRQKKVTSRMAERGFTLTEIIVVLVIITILMGVFVSRIMGEGEAAKARIAKTQMQQIKTKVNLFQLQYNVLPNSIEALAECNEQTGTSCIPLVTSSDDLKDVWGTPYQYALQDGGRSYVIRSLGANRIAGGSGADADFEIRGP